jgi:hypothetical protein
MAVVEVSVEIDEDALATASRPEPGRCDADPVLTGTM